MALGNYFAPGYQSPYLARMEYPTGGYKVLSPGPGSGWSDYAKLGVPTRYLSAEQVYGGPILGLGSAGGVAAGVGYGLFWLVAGAAGGAFGGLMISSELPGARSRKPGVGTAVLAAIGALVGASVGAVVGFKSGKATVDTPAGQ